MRVDVPAPQADDARNLVRWLLESYPDVEIRDTSAPEAAAQEGPEVGTSGAGALPVPPRLGADWLVSPASALTDALYAQVCGLLVTRQPTG